MQVTIKREKAINQPYPRSGNFDTQKPRYDWHVCVGDRIVGILPSLKMAKELAKDFKADFEVLR